MSWSLVSREAGTFYVPSRELGQFEELSGHHVGITRRTEGQGYMLNNRNRSLTLEIWYRHDSGHTPYRASVVIPAMAAYPLGGKPGTSWEITEVT